MRRLVLILILLTWTSAAHADGDVGMLVTGDPTMQPQLLALTEGWLRAHGHQVVASPLPPEGANKLIDCFVIEDTTCARKIVEGQSKTGTVVFMRVDVTDNATSGMRDVSITGYWFERGGDPVAEKRSCEKCTDTTLRSTADDLMSALAGSTRKTVGQLALTSMPSGARVAIDGTAAGVTPLQLALPPGEHQITISADGHPDIVRTVTIVKGQSVPLDVALKAPSLAPHRAKLPLLIAGAGAALFVAGIVVYATSDTDTGATYQYRDTRPLGLGLVVGGLAAAGIGTWLWFKDKPADSTPRVVLLPGAAYVGWARTF